MADSVPIHVLASAAGLGAQHVIFDGVLGMVLRVTGPTTAVLARLIPGDLGTGADGSGDHALFDDGTWKTVSGGGGGGGGGMDLDFGSIDVPVDVSFDWGSV